jgi:hypothetical protein
MLLHHPYPLVAIGDLFLFWTLIAPDWPPFFSNLTTDRLVHNQNQYSEESILLNILDLANTAQWLKLVRIWKKTWMVFYLTRKMELPEKDEETEYSRAETGIGFVHMCRDSFFLFWFRYDPKNLFLHSMGTTDLL